MRAPRAEAVVDLSAVAGNVRAIGDAVGAAEVMAVVKADGYGHGLVPSARAALAGGATWLGTAFPEEALALRAAGVTARVLTWLPTPGEDWDPVLAADVDVSVGAPGLLAEVEAAAVRTGRPARVHLEADTGLSRGGATPTTWPALVDAALRAQARGTVRLVGLWSHLACADEPEHPANAEQQARFADMLATAQAMGADPEVRHLAGSAGALHLPGTRYDLVRAGIATYGLAPAPAVAGPAALGLVPAMTLVAHLSLVKRVAAGKGVSYGHTETTARETTLGVVPLGYGDGVPRHASSTGPVLVAGERRRVVGRVCMDQVIVDLGADAVTAGEPAVLFGPGRHGEPTAQDWADAAGTISYEVVTRIGARVPRTYERAPW
ncbi:alanine racemase [Vallicoccus soli]|uniref:Alanine racemase n=1 Tax=Vallicoccus soli TaxID=2339232 RepID=A0A3A3YQ55_9ACTN|nr:alanine racemase [Vallicoccus soli]RJK93484.1 alanine racemase [Vallicoccus soli]